MGIRGLIFDVDGTLADTLPLCIEAFQRTVIRHGGGHLSAAEVISHFGPTEEGMLREILGTGKEAALTTYLEEYELLHQFYREPFPGLREVLQQLQARGITLAIVTGKGRESAEITCRHLALRDYFTVLECGSPRGAIKPDSIRAVLWDWKLPRDQVGYLGDAPSDVEAARKAGVHALAAGWASTADLGALARRRPDELFRTVDEFSSWVARNR